MKATTSKITLKEVLGMDLAIKKVIEKHNEKQDNSNLWWKESELYQSVYMISNAEKRGEERGKRQKSLEIANKLLLLGLNLEEISEVIGLSIDELACEIKE